MSTPSQEHGAGAVDVAGPVDAPPVVLVHGTLFNRTMWAPQRDALADEYRVVVPDLPGHGARRDESFRLEEGVRTVADAVDRHADGPVHLVGLSLGGYVAATFAGRYPDRVADLVLTGSSVNPTGLAGILFRLNGGVALLASKSGLVERAVGRLMGGWVRRRELPPEHVREIVDAGFDLRPAGEAGFQLAGEDVRETLSAFDGPVFVLNGERDVVMRLGEDAHARAVPDGRVDVVADAGHTCNLEQPAAYEAGVRRFVLSSA